MKTPQTTAELMKLLSEMEHRERFVFPASKGLKNQFDYIESIEVYATILHDVKGQPKNINVKAVTMDGKLCEHKQDGSTLNKSKYLRLFHEDYARSILSIIDGTYNEQVQISQQYTQIR